MIDIAKSIADKFERYVQIDTQSDPESTSFPSTEKQKDLLRLLVDELKAMGYEDAMMDEHGYVFATVAATAGLEKLPTVCFCAHVDTAPDCSGTGVKPILHKNYSGADIVLPDDENIVISSSKHPYLKEKIGDDIFTASGTTLLGADDKAGVAIIMTLAEYLAKVPTEHGRIRILFTPDEEVGRGVEMLDMKRLDANFGYTLDGGTIGSLEGDSFSADSMTVHFQGIAAHPGYAKNNLVNSSKVLSYFISLLPDDEWSPETTEGEEGFVHPVKLIGEMENSSAQFIIRSFNTEDLNVYENRLEKLAEQAIKKYPGASYTVEVHEQYRNMREILAQNPQVEEYALDAIKLCGLTPKTEKIRGGTDGSRLSFMGLPCPNLFTGEMALHSKEEYVSLQDMEASMKVCLEILNQIKIKNS